MKQILGIRFSEHGQVVACVYNVPDGGECLDREHKVMADLEYGRSLGWIVWHRLVGDDTDISGLDLSRIGDDGPADGDLKRAPKGGNSRSQEGEKSPPMPGVRPATEEEAGQAEENRQLCREARDYCRRCIQERELDMKLVDVETLFDRSKMIFYFTAPTRIDFRDLVKDLVRQYRTRIELRQIGVRHETQMLGALGNCGMVCCCRRYLNKFAPVTIKMAKEQNLFLNPAKISGICGRLLCCLSFEQENYDAFHRSCPKLGKRYQTDNGPMRVLRGNMFRNSVVVLPDGGPEMELTLDEWRAIQPHRPESQPAPPKEPKPAHNLMVVSASPDTLDNDLAAWNEDGSAPSEERPGIRPEPRPDQDEAGARKTKPKKKKPVKQQQTYPEQENPGQE